MPPLPLTLVAIFLSIFLGELRTSQAHDVRGTAVYLDVGDSRVSVEVQIPLEQLALALEKPLAQLPAQAFSAQAQSYVQQHLNATARNLQPFASRVESSRVQHFDDGDSLVTQLSLLPPTGESARWLHLHFDGVVHRVVTHNIYVFVRHDLKNAVLGEKPELIGLLHYQQKELIIDRTAGSFLTGFKAVFWLGTRHIAEGTDHLLFLLMLLLPASLVASRGRWALPAGAARSFREIAKLVTAFTFGHSLTLLLGAVLGLQLPTQLVEVLIALSILISALHALRPIFAGREALIAAGFGLVHGLAFATVLLGFGFERTTLWVSLFGFNLGVEAMQLAVVTVTMPWLVLLSRSRAHRFVRVAGALFGAVAACGWLAQRLFALETPIPALVERAAAQAPYVALALALAALLLTAARRRTLTQSVNA